jgi:hypothetical protein
MNVAGFIASKQFGVQNCTYVVMGGKKGFSRTRKGNVIVFDMNFASLISVC